MAARMVVGLTISDGHTFARDSYRSAWCAIMSGHGAVFAVRCWRILLSAAMY